MDFMGCYSGTLRAEIWLSQSWRDNKRNQFLKKSSEVTIIVYYENYWKTKHKAIFFCEIQLEFESQLYIEDVLARPNTIHLIKWVKRLWVFLKLFVQTITKKYN